MRVAGWCRQKAFIIISAAVRRCHRVTNCLPSKNVKPVETKWMMQGAMWHLGRVGCIKEGFTLFRRTNSSESRESMGGGATGCSTIEGIALASSAGKERLIRFLMLYARGVWMKCGEANYAPKNHRDSCQQIQWTFGRCSTFIVLHNKKRSPNKNTNKSKKDSAYKLQFVFQRSRK